MVLRGTGAGAGYVFKRSRRTEAQLRWLSHVMAPARTAGINVSLPVPTVTGAMLNDGWTMEDFVDGRTGTNDDLRALAPKMAAFHRAAIGIPQRPGFASVQDLLTVQHGGDIDLTAMPQTLVAQCRKAWHLLPEQPQTLIHADLNPGNLIVTDNGTPVLLDWDEARIDLDLFDHNAMNPSEDFRVRAAALAFEIAVCWCIEPERAQELARALPDALTAAEDPRQ